MQITIADEAVPYLVLLINTLIFHGLRKIFLVVSPEVGKLVLAEIIATVELCTGCAELGVAYEVHGYLGLGIALLIVCLWWCYVWGDAEACPCGPLEECLMGSGMNRDVMKKLIGQALGGALAYTYAMLIWSYHMTPEHEQLHTAAHCQAGLQVHMVYGALIEGFITLLSRVVALESASWPFLVCVSANAVVTTILVLAATSTTGGFFNPILASSLTLGCKGNTLVEHFVVYWVGSLAGGFLGRFLYDKFRSGQKEKYE